MFIENRYFLISFVLLLIIIGLFPFGVKGITEECQTDSILNYFPQARVESIFGFKADSISGQGIDYTCNGGEAVFNFKISTGQKEYFTGQEVVIPINLEVRIRKNASAAAAATFFQQITIAGGGTALTGPSDKKSVLGLGDESVLISSLIDNIVFRQTGVVRKNNFVYVVIGEVFPATFQSLYPLAYNQLSPQAVEAKVKELLAFAISRPTQPYGGAEPKPSPVKQPSPPQFQSPAQSPIPKQGIFGIPNLLFWPIVGAAAALITTLWFLKRKPGAPPGPPQDSSLPPPPSPPPLPPA